MKPETINKLVNEAVANGADPGKLVANFFQQEQNIKRSVLTINRKMQEIKDEYNLKMEKEKNNLQAVRDSCPHLEFSFHGDPSGGNDSHNSCNWCGKEW